MNSRFACGFLIQVSASRTSWNFLKVRHALFVSRPGYNRSTRPAPKSLRMSRSDSFLLGILVGLIVLGVLHSHDDPPLARVGAIKPL